MGTDREVENLIYNLIYLRRQHGLSKKHMARILGIGIHSPNLIESGALPPRLGANIFYEIYSHFKVTPSVILLQRLDEI